MTIFIMIVKLKDLELILEMYDNGILNEKEEN